MSAAENLKLVQGIYTAFGRADLPAILAAVAPDCAWELIGPPAIPFAGPRIGPAGAASFFQDLLSAVAIEAFSVDEMHADDATVWVLGHETMINQKTGAEVSYRWVHVFWIREGMLSRWQESGDTGTLLALFR